ncbi:MAG: hypothetical protein IJ682_03725 [Lachnospiraceae bacterium]|nr:hypothetical protein [Lachnospiraceae bacterium]
MCKLLENCGFAVCYKSYFMSFLFFPILLLRVFLEKIGFLKKQSERSEEEREKIFQSQFKSRLGIVNIILGIFERIEQKQMKKSARVLFGSSIIMVAKKAGVKAVFNL